MAVAFVHVFLSQVMQYADNNEVKLDASRI